jgi:hypothetical protein
LTETDFFTETGATYYATGQSATNYIKSNLVTATAANVITDVKIVVSSLSTTKYFYLGWLVSGNAHFARVEASPSGLPIIDVSAAVIANMAGGGSSVPGRSTYSIAAGRDSLGNDIVGVLYSQEDAAAQTNCVFQAYIYSGAAFIKYKDPLPLSTGAVCLFPNLFYNEDVGTFMAVYADDSGTSGGDTVYAEFTLDASAGGALSPAVPTNIVITNRAVSPCLMEASYSEIFNKISTVSVQGDCVTGAPDLVFDSYKAREK